MIFTTIPESASFLDVEYEPIGGAPARRNRTYLGRRPQSGGVGIELGGQGLAGLFEADLGARGFGGFLVEIVEVLVEAEVVVVELRQQPLADEGAGVEVLEVEVLELRAQLLLHVVGEVARHLPQPA